MIGFLAVFSLTLLVGLLALTFAILWAAMRTRSRIALVASPFAIYGLAALFAIDSHRSYNSSEIAFMGGAGPAWAMGILAMYLSISAGFLLTIVSLPLWWRRQNKLRIGNA